LRKTVPLEIQIGTYIRYEKDAYGVVKMHTGHGKEYVMMSK